MTGMSRPSYNSNTNNNTITSINSNRPPTQVYTRGTTGAVKTRSRSPTIVREGSVSSSSGGTGSRLVPIIEQQYPNKPPRHQQQQQHNHYHLPPPPSTTSSRDGHSSYYSAASSDHEGSVVSTSTGNGSGSRNNNNTNKTVEFRDQKEHRRKREHNEKVSPADLIKQHIKIARSVVDELLRSHNAAERRIAAVTNACETFDHNNEAKHNIELYHGAAGAIAKLLLVVAYNNDDEIRMLLSALEMVFRGSPKSVTDAFLKINNSTQLLQTLLRHLERFETRNVKHAEISIFNISRILHSCSRSSELRSTLLRPSGMLPALVRIQNLNDDCRQVRIRLIANLANCEENKVLMYDQPGMVDVVLRIGHFDDSALSRQYAGAALMEFSSAPCNQVSMAHNQQALGTLVKMVLIEKSATCRESAITALQNLAFTKENRTVLVTFKDGIVLEALKKALASDPDAKARRRSAGALTNLACDETAEIMGNHNRLLDTLAIASTKDDNEEVQTRSSLALTKIASSVTVHMACHNALLDALVVASLSKMANSVSAVLRVKARAQENRKVLARHPGIIDTLADICISETTTVTDKDNSVRAIMHLVNEDQNRKIMCNKTVLTACVKAANYNNTDLLEARDSAIRAMERLATEPSNRSYMAHHDGLLVVVAKAVEREAKWEQQGHDSEYGFLAKPLLMSLLVAM